MTLDEVRALARKADHLVCDTNVLLTLVCGYAEILPDDWKRAANRTVEAVLTAAVQANDSIVVLPTILAEASNFVTNAPSHLRWNLSVALGTIAEKYVETYTASRTLVRDHAYATLGLSDVDVVLQADALVLSTDTSIVNERWARGLLAVDPHAVDLE